MDQGAGPGRAWFTGPDDDPARARALLLVLGPRPARDVGRWLQDGLRAAVVEGRVAAGTVLPSGRDAASRSGSRAAR
nr:hypothetical protein [Cellulosimicrobium sp. MM]